MMAHLPHDPHPGEILQDEFLVPLALTQNQLAIVMKVRIRLDESLCS